MIDTKTRSQIARRSIGRAKRTERDVADAFRRHGWPDADRRVVTGYAAPTRARRDEGDLRGVDPLCVQVKSGDVSDADIPAMMAELTEQAITARADCGVLVVRRARKADPLRWWAYLSAGDFRHLVLGRSAPEKVHGITADMLAAPVRLELRDLFGWLHWAGYGVSR